MRLFNRIHRLRHTIGARLQGDGIDPVVDPFHESLGVAQHRHQRPGSGSITPLTDTDLCEQLEWWR